MQTRQAWKPTLNLLVMVRSAIHKAADWIKTHQRQTGYWYTRSPKINDELSTYVGTVYVIMALHACGEIP